MATSINSTVKNNIRQSDSPKAMQSFDTEGSDLQTFIAGDIGTDPTYLCLRRKHYGNEHWQNVVIDPCDSTKIAPNGQSTPHNNISSSRINPSYTCTLAPVIYNVPIIPKLKQLTLTGLTSAMGYELRFSPRPNEHDSQEIENFLNYINSLALATKQDMYWAQIFTDYESKVAVKWAHQNKHHIEYHEMPYRYIALTHSNGQRVTKDDYLKTRGKSHNRVQRKSLEEALKQGFYIERSLNWSDIESVMNERRTHFSNGADYTRATQFRNFLREFRQTLIEQGRWRETGLFDVHGTLVGFDMGFLHNGVLHSYQTAYREQYKQWRPGALSLDDFISIGIEDQSVQMIEFMGDNSYLHLFAKSILKFYRLQIYFRHSWRSQYFLFIKTLTQTLKQISATCASVRTWVNSMKVNSNNHQPHPQNVVHKIEKTIPSAISITSQRHRLQSPQNTQQDQGSQRTQNPKTSSKILFISACGVEDRYLIQQLSQSFTDVVVLRPLYGWNANLKSQAHNMPPRKPLWGKLQQHFHELVTKIRHRVHGRFAKAHLFSDVQTFYQVLENRTLHTIDPRELHSAETLRWIAEQRPDVIITSDAPIVKPELIGLSRLASINLHQGIAPCYRGNNTVFWPLLLRDFENIGLTIHHLTKGLDAGPIIAHIRPDQNTWDHESSLVVKMMQQTAPILVDYLNSLVRSDAYTAPVTAMSMGLDQKNLKVHPRLFLSKQRNLRAEWTYWVGYCLGWARPTHNKPAKVDTYYRPKLYQHESLEKQRSGTQKSITV